jgi:hypothetical protein
MSRKTKQPPGLHQAAVLALPWRVAVYPCTHRDHILQALAQRRHRGVSITRLPCPEIFEATPDVELFLKEFVNAIKRILRSFLRFHAGFNAGK